MKPFSIYVLYTAKPGCRQKFIDAVTGEGLDELIRREEGCLCYDYYLSVKDENRILLVEQWESEAHQQVHLKQPHMARLKEIKEENIEATKLGKISPEEL